mmetsp:Transcript_23732/g.35199  ORF Transcript_23732/g.35199 Transcript_23732/m.35199 type:complete len:373 (+) Transcript_23732:93-1211(+)
MDTPLEETNLALIGTDEDRLCKKAAADTEVGWDEAGQEEGVEVWRVENTRDENDNPKFGINPWPKERYGEFHNGDSYIVLQTVKDVSSGAFRYDIYFWIGAESSQDEYGVASYKAVELDDLFGDAPVQHREVQHYESEEFLKCFNGSVKYIDGGIDSGFRHAEEGVGDVTLPSRLYHVRKCGRATKSIQVPFACDSLNHGDAFVLDNGNVVYTWFGEQCSPFERSKAAEVAHNLVISRNGHATLEEDVGDNDTFFDVLGGKGDIKEKEDIENYEMPIHQDTKLYVLSDADSFIKVKEIVALQSNLESSDVCLVDTGDVIFVWIGSGSSLGEQSQAMRMAQKLMSALDRGANTNVVRVLEGQESRVHGFSKAF